VHNDTRNSGRSEQPNCYARLNTRERNEYAQIMKTSTKKTKSTSSTSNTKSGSQKKRNVRSASILLETKQSVRKKKLNLSLPLTKWQTKRVYGVKIIGFTAVGLTECRLWNVCVCIRAAIEIVSSITS